MSEISKGTSAVHAVSRGMNAAQLEAKFGGRLVVPRLKKCAKCKRRKPCAQFQRRAASADGLRFRCKACTSKDAAKARARRAV